MSGTPSSLEKTLSQIEALLSKVKTPTHDDWDPIELGLLISRLEYEDLDVAAQKESFQQLVNSHLKDLDPKTQFWDRIEFVNFLFAKTLGFQGDTGNYYNIKNSFLNDVLLRRKGIPITLSLAYMGICRMAGLKAVGIAFPGHFLVRIVTPQESEGNVDWKQHRFIDCFDAARVLSVADCESRLDQWTRGTLVFGPEAVRVAHPQEIVSRMLRNLRALFAEKEDLARLYWVLTALIEVCPNERVESYKERGLLMGRMGRFQNAASDLRKYVGMCQDPAKVAHADRLLSFFEGRQDFTN